MQLKLGQETFKISTPSEEILSLLETQGGVTFVSDGKPRTKIDRKNIENTMVSFDESGGYLTNLDVTNTKSLSKIDLKRGLTILATCECADTITIVHRGFEAHFIASTE